MKCYKCESETEFKEINVGVSGYACQNCGEEVINIVDTDKCAEGTKIIKDNSKKIETEEECELSGLRRYARLLINEAINKEVDFSSYVVERMLLDSGHTDVTLGSNENREIAFLSKSIKAMLKEFNVFSRSVALRLADVVEEHELSEKLLNFSIEKEV